MNKILKGIIFLGIFSLLIVLIITSYGFQSFIGSILSGLDPKRAEHLYVDLEQKNSNQLKHLIIGGDLVKAGVASEILKKNQAIDSINFLVARGLSHSKLNTRFLARRTIVALSPAESEKILLADIQKYNENQDDYLDVLRMLVYIQSNQAYSLVNSYSQREDALHSDIAYMFRDLKDVRGLEALENMKKKLIARGEQDSRAFDRVAEAIISLSK